MKKMQKQDNTTYICMINYCLPITLVNDNLQ